MLIDWFTVVAQAINFLILVWLLKRFLYKPILDAIDSREQRIAKELADAEAKKAEANQERDTFQRKNEELAQQRDALVNQMTDEVNEIRQRLLDDARRAADALSVKLEHELQRAQQNISDEISRRAQNEVFSITRKVLEDLADASLEERIAKVFIRQVRELNGEAELGLAKALKSSTDPVRIRSAFELAAQQQTAIQQAIHDKFSVEVPVRFEVAPDVISGIDLTAGGRQVAWNIGDYLKSLERSIGELTQEPSKPTDQPDSTTGQVS